jgi:putative DNA primase/helicase
MKVSAEMDAVLRRHRSRPDPTNGMAMLPPPSMPMQVARQFLKTTCMFEDGTTPKLRYWRGGWWVWRTSYWQEIDDRAMRSLLYKFTENAFYAEDKDPKPWAPNRKRIGDLIEALSAICILPTDIDQPCWLDECKGGTVVAMNNGLLDVEHGRLFAHTPLFFNQTAVPFDYEPNAPEPARWLEFLGELWPDEPNAIDALSEWYGYVISGRTDLHKILLMIGPTRGGKGVIARILTALIGRQNVAGPTLNSLGGEFGLAPLIGKPLAVISDARFVGKNGNIVVERLLSISGEDTLTVNRKYRDQWTGKLPCRLHVVSNELPKLGDASTAVIGRMVLLVLSRSWLGREDHNLEIELGQELPGILNWSLQGLHRLTVENNNSFTRTASADEAVIQMRDLASPVAAFVREKCKTGRDLEVEVDVLYGTYKQWCQDNEHQKASKHIFGRDLRAVLPTLRKTRPRRGIDQQVRQQVYTGVGLRGDDGADEEPD